MNIELSFIRKESREELSCSANEIIIGRKKYGQTVHLDLWHDAYVSRPHAKIYYYLHTWWIKDLESKHGTSVNGSQISQATELFAGDRVIVGETQIEIDFSVDEDVYQTGSISSTSVVRETEVPQAISEDNYLTLLPRIVNIPTYCQGKQMLEAFVDELVLAFPHSNHWSIGLIQEDDICPCAIRPVESVHFSFTLARKAITSQTALLWEKRIISGTEESKIPSLIDTVAAIYAPIICNNEVIGFVHTDITSSDSQFSRNDLDKLSVIANTMGPALKASSSELFDRFPRVYIAFQSDDLIWVQQLAKDLRRQSIRVIFNPRIIPGISRRKTIQKAVFSTDALLQVCSEIKGEIPATNEELELAKLYDRPIIPLMRKPSELSPFLKDLSPIIMDQANYSSKIGELSDAIKKLPKNNLKKEKETVKILILAANPLETTPLQLDEEIHEIDERLRKAEFRDQFLLIPQLAVRYSEITEQILRHSPQIVHFSGHGNRKGEIILLDNNEKKHSVPGPGLSRLFHVLKDMVSCVVLNACWSGKQAKSIAEEINCVVGMTWSIEDKAAKDFAGGFYQALGYGRNVQDAFDLGCIQIALSINLPASAKPKLLTKPGINASDIYFV